MFQFDVKFDSRLCFIAEMDSTSVSEYSTSSFATDESEFVFFQYKQIFLYWVINKYTLN